MTVWSLLLIPLLGAVVVGLAPTDRAKWIAFIASSVTFVMSVIAALRFAGWTGGGFGLDTQTDWLSMFGITLNMHADTISLLLVLLTTLLMPACMAGSFSAITSRIKEYYVWMLILQAAMVGVFLARDLIFFYICFEFTLVPMYFLIAIYGGENRAKAATKFFIFTFTGSMITLAGLLYIAWQHAASPVDGFGFWSFDIPQLTTFAASQLSPLQQGWLVLALMAGFAVKVPLFPVHTWLPLAHTEAPTAGSVILAGVLLKLGTYGLYRFVLPMLPAGLLGEVNAFGLDFIPIRLIAIVSIIGILYAALICWVQDDIKRLVAYSSVSHLGFCVLGLFALNPLGAEGSVLYMLNHGLSTGALFFLVGMMYERYHTRDMNRIGGLSRRMPVWAFFMVFFVLSSVGLPGLNGFVSEFLCLIGAFTASADASPYPGVLGPWYAAVAAIGMIFAAMYLLIMVGKVVFGPLKEPRVDHEHDHGSTLPADLTPREIAVLVPLAIPCIYIGLQPTMLMKPMEAPIENVLQAAAYPERVESMTLADEEDADGALPADAVLVDATETTEREGTDG